MRITLQQLNCGVGTYRMQQAVGILDFSAHLNPQLK
jgi:hypothetical protein